MKQFSRKHTASQHLRHGFVFLPGTCHYPTMHYRSARWLGGLVLIEHKRGDDGGLISLLGGTAVWWSRTWTPEPGCLGLDPGSATYCVTLEKLLNLSELYKMRIMIVHTSRGCCEISLR